MKLVTYIKTHGCEVAAGGLVAGYSLVMSIVCLLKYAHMRYYDFDVAVHAQSMWGILHGTLDCSIIGVPFLGNHMVPILFLLAPLCLIFSPAPTLLVIQAIVLGLGGWAVFLLARRELGRFWALLFTLTYLIYPPLLFLNLYEFHPIALTVTILLFAFNSYRGRRLLPFLALSALAMLCQENVALIILGFGLLACVERRSRAWILIPILSGAIYFIGVVGFLMPQLNHTIQFVSIYGQFGDSLPEVALSILRHPIVALTTMLEPAKLKFLSMLAAPLAYISLLSPGSLIPLLLILPQRLLSARPTETMLLYHYQAEFIPFIFVSAIAGAKRILTWSNRYRVLRLTLAAALGVMPLITMAVSGIVPRLIQDVRSSPWTSPAIRAQCAKQMEAVGPDDSVLATFEFLPQLSARRQLCSLHHLYMGSYTLSHIPFPIPDRLDWVFLNTLDPLTFQATCFYDPQGSTRLRSVLGSSNWDVVENLDSLVVLRHTDQRGSFPDALIRYVSSVSPAYTNFLFQTNGMKGVTLLGFDLGQRDADGSTPLTLYWKKAAQGNADDFTIWVGMESRGLGYVAHLVPGARLYPPQDWPPGQTVEDHHHLALPATFDLSNIAGAEFLALPVTH